MILQYAHLHRRPALFKAMTGLLLAEFDALAWDLLPQIAAVAGSAPPATAAHAGGGRRAPLPPEQPGSAVADSGVVAAVPLCWLVSASDLL